MRPSPFIPEMVERDFCDELSGDLVGPEQDLETVLGTVRVVLSLADGMAAPPAKPEDLIHLLALIEPSIEAIHDSVRGARRILDIRIDGLQKESRKKEVAS